MINTIRRFLADRRGLSSIVFAGASLMLFGFGAMAVDVSSFFYQKRRQQTATDLAALAAAADLERAANAARASASRNARRLRPRTPTCITARTSGKSSTSTRPRATSPRR